MKRKLVRDKIPDIVGMYGHISGKRVRFFNCSLREDEQVHSSTLRVELERKLQEEAAEFLLVPVESDDGL